MKEEDRLEREAMERRLRKDLVTKTFPKTREDFDQLYAMVIYSFILIKPQCQRYIMLK